MNTILPPVVTEVRSFRSLFLPSDIEVHLELFEKVLEIGPLVQCSEFVQCNRERPRYSYW